VTRPRLGRRSLLLAIIGMLVIVAAPVPTAAPTPAVPFVLPALGKQTRFAF